MRWMRGAVGAGVLVLAACTSAGGGARAGVGSPSAVGSSASAAALPGSVAGALAVEIRQSRADWGRRVVQVRVANTGTEDVTVRSATVRSPTVDGPATSEKGREVRAGVDRDLSVALGDPVCGPGSGAAGSGGRVQVELDVVDERGRAGTVVAVPEDPQGHLARIHGEDCAALAVAAGARLRLDDALPRSTVEGVVVGSLVLHVEPVPGGPRVEVWQVDRTNLVIPADLGNDWPVAVDTAALDGPTTVVLPAVPSRCDPHAVAEDKRGTFFGVHARVDGVDQAVFYVPSSDELRGAVYDLVGASCGWPPD
ncbi:hypothetical protein [Cellulomonas fimi]|uniref:DUF4352 domain-containing protein n=1 Tax=Cellulomonas fimi (strain ATCC 484 / DSM 20113 / JCM 1341 / CCUG 24087 / LMG 16345 / NBRC 15513 / NCIMB 8980 / NCTC 7547 / NRS-133) TaxID=590998 RepID=F4H175_CELFA|nr:hypothetical protein [Cellulomonas fimi]AEE47444.1 hypothetical protein Celf_3331 [Cellulomonas fimi ATCC 484]NNH05578.1 hypothetical protein [Cellulomonas fimi]VEH36240.1 Uncharacterised protein [Cellulomonas fimi]